MLNDLNNQAGPPQDVLLNLIDVHTQNGTLDNLLNSGIGCAVFGALPSQSGALSAYTVTYGFEPWSYDGTTLTMIADIYPGGDSEYAGDVGGFLAVNGALNFTAVDPTYGYELRRYDPDTATVDTFDFLSGADSSFALVLGAVNGKLVVGASIDETGDGNTDRCAMPSPTARRPRWPIPRSSTTAAGLSARIAISSSLRATSSCFDRAAGRQRLRPCQNRRGPGTGFHLFT